MADTPLTDLTFNILVTLADDELHGYALVKALRDLDGREAVRTGTVYAALARLRVDGLVEEIDDASGDSRRRVYRVTEHGTAAARAEASRLADALSRARRKRLLTEGSHG